jgi:hypothetical protein
MITNIRSFVATGTCLSNDKYVTESVFEAKSLLDMILKTMDNSFYACTIFSVLHLITTKYILYSHTVKATPNTIRGIRVVYFEPLHQIELNQNHGLCKSGWYLILDKRFRKITVAVRSKA